MSGNQMRRISYYIFFMFLGYAVPSACANDLPQQRLTKKSERTATQQKSSNAQPEQKQLIFGLAPNDYSHRKKALEKDFSRDLPSPQEAKKQYKEKKNQLDTQATAHAEPFWTTVTISDMNYHQLLKRKNELIVTGDYATAIKYLEHMFKLTETPEQIIYIMLEWAELLMKLEDYKRAEALFRDFVKLYPSNEYAEDAFKKAIECSWYQTSTYERDQSKTEETLQLIEEFNAREAVYSKKSIDQVLEIKTQCLTKLAQSNMYVAKHYIGLSKHRAAHKRLDNLRENDLPKVPSIEPQLLQLEIELAQVEHNSELEQKKLAELIHKFPGHEITIALTTPKKSWFTIA